MVRYDWICNECEVIWEEDHPIGTAPKETRCEECGEMRGRNWGSVTTFAMKGDCHTNRVKLRKAYNEGMDKDTAEEFYDGAIKNIKKRTNEGHKAYSDVEPVVKNWVEAGKATVRTDHQAQEARKVAKQLTTTVYNDIGRDPGKMDFNKTQ
jgi:hypothetical protein